MNEAREHHAKTLITTKMNVTAAERWAVWVEVIGGVQWFNGSVVQSFGD